MVTNNPKILVAPKTKHFCFLFLLLTLQISCKLAPWIVLKEFWLKEQPLFGTCCLLIEGKESKVAGGRPESLSELSARYTDFHFCSHFIGQRKSRGQATSHRGGQYTPLTCRLSVRRGSVYSGMSSNQPQGLETRLHV